MNTDDRALVDLIAELRGLLVKATEPHPDPWEAPDSRYDAIDVQNTNAGNHNQWLRRVKAARERVIDALPTLLDRLEAFHAKPPHDAVEQGARALARFYHPDADQDATSPPLWFSYLGEANAVLQPAALQSPPPVVSGEAMAIVARVAEGERSDDGHTALRDDANACLATPPVVEEGRREAAIAFLRQHVPNDAPLWNDDGHDLTNIVSWMCEFAAILALTPVEGVGVRAALEQAGDSLEEARDALEEAYLRTGSTDDLAAKHIADIECQHVRKALSTPVAAQGDEVREAALAIVKRAADGEWSDPGHRALMDDARKLIATLGAPHEG